MRKITLQNSDKVAIVDNADFDTINKYRWYLSSAGYARRWEYDKNYYAKHGKQKGKRVFMHRVINNTPPDLVTDHINRDKLDNRRSNLRSCTQTENTQNKSGYNCKGVVFVPRLGKYQARIQKNKVRTSLGFFNKENEAIDAYQEAARRLYA